MTDHAPGVPHRSPGWAALLLGLIPALLFIAVHGARRSYELFRATITSSRESAILLLTVLESHCDQVFLGIAAMLIVGLFAAWIIRQQLSRRRSTHQIR